MELPLSLLRVLSLAAVTVTAFPTPNEIQPGYPMGQFVEYRYPKCDIANQYMHVVPYSNVGKCLELNSESMGVDFNHAENGCALSLFKDKDCQEQFISLTTVGEGCFYTGVDSWRSAKLTC